MSEENVEIVQAAYDAYNRGDLDTVLSYAAPDFELDWSRGVGPQRGVYKLDQARPFFDDFGDTFESIRIEPKEFIEVDDDVIVPQTGYTRGRDGIETTARITLVWTIRDGAIVRICLYQDKQDALEAVGLSEYAMSEENVEIVRAHIEAFNRLDGSAVAFFDPHVVLDMSRVTGLDFGIPYGHAAATDTIRRYIGAFEEYAYEVKQLTDLGTGAVLANVAERGRGKKSGVRVERSFTALYTVIAGKIARVTVFPNEEEALEAAGLRE